MLDLDMSPYAAFVWPAWGVSALVLAALTVRAVIASRKWKRELERLEKDQSATSDAAVSLRPQAAQSAIGPLK
jgi:heme exporter protein D